MMTTDRWKPLTGVTVVDITHILAGPFCTQLLSDAGAQVIKIEPPGGEYARIRGPRRYDKHGNSVSSYNAAVNHGKQSIELDLKNDAGRALARHLIDKADVVVENFAPGALARLGIDLAEIRNVRPQLITASISLYGDTDPTGRLTRRGGLANVAEAESGILSRSLRSPSGPTMLPLPLGDMATALACYAAITTALFDRQRTGTGRHCDVSMLSTLVSLHAIEMTGAQIDEAGVTPAGMGFFHAADAWLTIGVNNDSLFERLCAAMEMPELAHDPRYATFTDRDQRAAEVNEIIAAWCRPLPIDAVLDRIGRFGVPCGRVNDPETLLRDRGLNLFVEIDDGIGGTIRVPRNPIGTDIGDVGIPRLGQHGHEVLSEVLGLDDAGFEALANAGAFGTRP